MTMGNLLFFSFKYCCDIIRSDDDDDDDEG